MLKTKTKHLKQREISRQSTTNVHEGPRRGQVTRKNFRIAPVRQTIIKAGDVSTIVGPLSNNNRQRFVNQRIERGKARSRKTNVNSKANNNSKRQGHHGCQGQRVR